MTLDPFTASMAGQYQVEVNDGAETVTTTANVTLEVPFIPAAGLFGLIVLASASALSGALALRRRR